MPIYANGPRHHGGPARGGRLSYEDKLSIDYMRLANQCLALEAEIDHYDAAWGGPAVLCRAMYEEDRSHLRRRRDRVGEQCERAFYELFWRFAREMSLKDAEERIGKLCARNSQYV